MKMKPYGVPRNYNAWDWDERGCQSKENKISSNSRRSIRRIFKKAFRLEQKRDLESKVLTNEEECVIVYTQNQKEPELCWLEDLDDISFSSSLLDK